MKQVDRFFWRYILSTLRILILFFVINIVLIGLFLLTAHLNDMKDSDFPIEHFASLIEKKEDIIAVDSEVQEILTQTDTWAMLLDEKGTVIWQNSLPKGLPLEYSATDIAIFSKWYLDDYPVKVWKHPDGLLVIGFQPGTRVHYYFSIKADYLYTAILGIICALSINICVMVILFIRNTRKIEIAMRPIMDGIRKLSQGKSFHLEEKGELAEINAGLNQAGAYLIKKDNTRAEWIRGISHDIRTPLSIILGYSSEMEDTPDLPLATKKQAGIIRKQSEKLRSLVANLNLTTKLEYSMQPVRMQTLNPFELARQVISDFFNSGLSKMYRLNYSEVDSDTVKPIYGDISLLNRMLHNLIQNSIIHNPKGCQISVSAKIGNGTCIFCVTDSGCGIKESYLTLLNNDTSIPSSQEGTEETEHGLGLKIVRQIVKVHQGTIRFSNVLPHGLKVEIHLPEKLNK